MPFGKTGAKKKPTVVCVGTMESFGDLVKSKTEGSPYHYEEVKIRPLGTASSASKNPKLLFMWDSVWFQARFANQKTFKEAMSEWQKANEKEVTDNDGNTEVKPGSTFVFDRNISSQTKGDQAFLAGLAGTPEAADEIESALTRSETPLTADEAHTILADFFAESGDVPFIYVLRQEMKDGVLGEWYEVQTIAWLTEDNVKKFVKKAERQAKNIASKGEKAGAPIVFKFDPSDYGIEVALPETAEPAWVQ